MKHRMECVKDEHGNIVFDVGTEQDFRARFFKKDDAEKFLKECQKEEFKVLRGEYDPGDEGIKFNYLISSQKTGAISGFENKEHAEAFLNWLENGC